MTELEEFKELFEKAPAKLIGHTLVILGEQRQSIKMTDNHGRGVSDADALGRALRINNQKIFYLLELLGKQ